MAKRPTKAQLLARARFIARFGSGKKRKASKRKAGKRKAGKRKHVAAKTKKRKAGRKHDYLTHRGKLYRQVKGTVSRA